MVEQDRTGPPLRSRITMTGEWCGTNCQCPSASATISSGFVIDDLDVRFPQVGTLTGAGYLAGDQLSSALFLAVRMGQPILLEGEPGVGKTEAAKALASALDTRWSGSSAMRASRPPRRCTSGTTPASCWPSG